MIKKFIIDVIFLQMFELRVKINIYCINIGVNYNNIIKLSMLRIYIITEFYNVYNWIKYNNII